MRSIKGVATAKRLLTGIVAITLIITIVISGYLISKAADLDLINTSGVNFFVTINEDGNFVMQTADRRKTSKISYTTIGIQISRTKYGTQEYYVDGTDDTYTIEYQIDDVELVNKHPVENGIEYNTRILDANKILEDIKKSPDWYDDYLRAKEEGVTYCLMFDSVMTTVINDHPEGAYLDENATIRVDKTYAKGQLNEIQNHTYNWADKSGLKTHYEKPLKFLDGVPFIKSEIADLTAKQAPPYEKIDRIGKEKPDVYTYNTSPDFDLSQGIPTSEDITNGINVNEWYGIVDIGHHTVTKQYLVPYYISWEEDHGYYDEWDDEDGYTHRDWIEHWVTMSETGYFTVSRTAKYYYVWDMNLFKFKEAQTWNDTYPAGIINYESDHDMDYTIKVNGVENPTSVEAWFPKDTYHVTWYQYSGKRVSVGKGHDAHDEAYNQAHSEAENRVKNPTVRNDTIIIRNNKGQSFTYMDGRDCNLNTYSEPFKYKAVGDTDYSVEEYDETVTIPDELPNGSYQTSFNAMYTKFGVATGATKNFSKEGAEAILDEPEKGNSDHSGRSYKVNEPVYVHTPVISPVDIINPETGNKLTRDETPTQLITESNLVEYELLLDHTYTFKFDAGAHRDIQGYGWSGDPSKFDKYVKQKYARFPFSVRVNGEYYECYADGFTEWIPVDNDETEFYISPWSKEGVYGVGGINAPWNASENMIEYKVLAINTVTNEQNAAQHPDANMDGSGNRDTENDYYVATYRYPVEVSGIIYNFQAVGINDTMTFSGKQENVSSPYPFCENFQEKKVGTKNRLGGDAVRYTKDSHLDWDWDLANTLAFGSGKSNVFDGMGYLIKGNRFSFSVETIANLWSLDQDSIRIKPVFRYVDKNGMVNENIQVCYNYADEWFIEQGSTRDDQKVYDVRLADGQFKSSYTDAQVEYTAKQSNAFYKELYNTNDTPYSVNGILQKSTPSYNLGNITLNPTQRLYTGDEEKFGENLSIEPRNVPSISGDVDTMTYNQMHYSMQTWYGSYFIPEQLFVCDGNIDIHDYAEQKGSISTDDDIWIKDGYLILNFEIETINEGHPHLSYYGGTGSMWKTEQGDDPKTVTIKELGTDVGVTDIPTKDGDVAVVALDLSMGDYWTNDTFIIN